MSKSIQHIIMMAIQPFRIRTMAGASIRIFRRALTARLLHGKACLHSVYPADCFLALQLSSCCSRQSRCTGSASGYCLS